MPKKDKPFIIKVSYEAVYQARDADDAEETALNRPKTAVETWSPTPS
jgi:hypothetical protein